MEELTRPEVRLLTMTGPPGIGKTRLAVAATSDLFPIFPHGVYFVDLSPVFDPRLVIPTAARVLGVREVGGRPIIEGLIDYLADRRVLLLLDNMEQLLESGPELSRLLSCCPGLKLLATSREALHLRWEHLFPVPPLDLPDISWPDVDTLSTCSSVALFVDRARAVRPGFRLHPGNAGPIARICLQLEGIPLAIELAASRAEMMGAGEILERLRQQGLEIVTGRAVDVPERHKTLRGAIEWSYRLLDEAEKALFRRVTVFAAGGTIDAAREVVGESSSLDVEAGMTSLGRKSLARFEGDGIARFHMLEMVREYGLGQLLVSGEEEAVRTRHADHYLSFIEANSPEVFGPPDRARLERLEAEQDNLRAALRWLLDTADAERAVRMAARFGWFCSWTGRITEGRQWLERALSRRDSVSRVALASGLAMVGHLAWRQGDATAARRPWEEALPIWRELGAPPWVMGLALSSIAIVANYQGDYAAADPLCEEALEICTPAGEKWGTACALGVMGIQADDRGDLEQASSLYAQAASLFEETGDLQFLSIMLAGAGSVALRRGEHPMARSFAEQSLEAQRRTGQPQFAAEPLCLLGEIALAGGDLAGARVHLHQGTEAGRATGDGRVIARALEGFAGLGMVLGDERRAVRVLGAAEALRLEIGSPLPPSRQPVRERLQSHARSALGEDGSESEWARGLAMEMGRAIGEALAMQVAPARVRQNSSRRSRNGALSRREVEVAALIGKGLTSPEIAARLVISPRTAENHVNSILQKLGCTTRAQVAVWAAEQCLGVPPDRRDHR